MIANTALTGSVADIARFRPGDHADCPYCEGRGWFGESRPQCCCGSDWECGASGCTGPIAEHVQVACEACFGTGTVPPAPNTPPHDPSDKLGEGDRVGRVQHDDRGDNDA